MKFLCDNCKAKYQIADEKVAGKTVRMKCRKCGHQIEVRAAVTETSVSTSPPKAPEAPRPGVAPRGSLATSLSAQKPRAPAPAQPAPSGSALAGAFQKTVQDTPQSVPPPGAGPVELSVTDEWYVAINGVPVGPVRISELRRKAASGAVTEESLCWQEGLEEWRPVRSVPELASIVREAAQGNRPSLTAPPPADQRTSSPPRPPARSAPQAPRASEPPRDGGTRPLAAPLAPARSNVVPLRPAASSHDDMAAGPFGGGAAAALAPQFSAPQPAPVQPIPSPFGSQPALTPAPVAIADPFAIPPAPLAAPAASSTSNASLAAAAPYSPSLAPPQRRAGVPLWFWLVALFTVSFGGVAAYAMFFRQQPQQAPVVIQMPATNTPTATTATDVPPPTVNPEPTTTAAPTATTGGKVATGGPKAGAAAPAGAATEKKTTDLSGLLGGTSGPGVGGGPSGPGAGGGGGLDQSSVERVVASHRTGVKRTCWERGGADQKSSVNVTVTATVGPDGSVTNTSSSGDDPVVGKCIENQVRSWRFNAPGSSTTINIPFKFVRQ